METEFSEIGMRMAGLRDACNVTQKDMAAELGVSLETYQNWEKGRTSPFPPSITWRISSTSNSPGNSPAPPRSSIPTMWSKRARARKK